VCPGGARASTNVSLALPIDVTIAELSTAAIQLIDPGNSGGHCGEVQPDGDSANHAEKVSEADGDYQRAFRAAANRASLFKSASCFNRCQSV
jgi:hypothetical protein